MKMVRKEKKKMKVAINGFGRIGRLVLRAFFEAAVKKKVRF